MMRIPNYLHGARICLGGPLRLIFASARWHIAHKNFVRNLYVPIRGWEVPPNQQAVNDAGARPDMDDASGSYTDSLAESVARALRRMYYLGGPGGNWGAATIKSPQMAPHGGLPSVKSITGAQPFSRVPTSPFPVRSRRWRS